MVHFVKEALVHSLAFSWPCELCCWHGGSSGLLQPPSNHILSLRDFPGKVPSLEPAGLSQGSAGSPPRKPRLPAQDAASEPKIGRLASGLHWNLRKGAVLTDKAAGSQHLQGSRPPPAQRFTVDHPT